MTERKLIKADVLAINRATAKAVEFLESNKFYADARGVAIAAISEYILFSEGKTQRAEYVTPKPSKVSDFLAGYNGKQLLRQHKLSEYGVWHVYGEDPNCDLSGSHSQPFLGAYEGTLESVLPIAVNLRNFYQWGSGGDIRKIEVEKVR